MIPGDLYCSIELRPLKKPKTPSAEPPQETASSTVPALPDDDCCVSTFVSESLELMSATPHDAVDVLLRSNFNGDVMASGRCPVKYLLDQKAQSNVATSDLDPGTAATTTTATSFKVGL